MAHTKKGLFSLFFNSRSASLSFPLLTATVFSFGYIIWHQPEPGALTTSSSQTSNSKSSTKLPDIPLAEEQHLSLIDTVKPEPKSYTNDRLGKQNNMSPQSNAVASNGAAQSSANPSAPAAKTTQKNTDNPVVKVILPLLP